MNDKSTKENASNLPADKIIATVVLWLDEQCPHERWDLSDEQICVLLGGITVSTWNQWKETAHTSGSLQVDQETIDTLAMLVSIYKMIHLSSPSGFKYDFFKRPINDPIFNGKSAREFMLENNSFDDFLKVRNFFRSKVLI
ncbi:MAG: hypothetical protein KJ609_11845 [Gammaproteobacteria bacterium]|nr:hypothetical protein [Gammaproteobacteria bacterium]MBU2023460.1 hypothetical protein [Gammaproteobacteria bacterium]MBU2237386.1 hypothetical protein [Gammaproteobacteria bacterium]MBU2319232.1 hypothetical protein [Gammaproteobacteria bacterium]MBU2412201.1 hypothetical protein [Gammaproteobacteria bacterium]